MLGRDVRRTTAAPHEVKPPFQRRWYRDFADEGLMYGIQPVVAGGRVYIGTLRGVLHAIDDATGNDVWTYRVPGGIFHAAAIEGGSVFICGGDGTLHAVDASNGKVNWTFETGIALWNAPLPHEGRVYFGGRDGSVHAVRDGKAEWSTPLGAPILASVALDPESGRLYVAAEDMRAYALEAATGRVLWKSERLQGFTFGNYHPVVVPQGGVVFTTRPFNRGWEGEADKTLDELLRKFYGTTRNDKDPKDRRDWPAFPNWRFTAELNRKLEAAVREKYREPDLWTRQFAFIREELVKHPHRQTVFLLDGATGKSRGVVPVVYCESNNGTTQPPLVLADGRVVIQVALGVLHSRHKDVAVLDPRTGDLALVQPPGPGNPNGTNLHIIPDEQAALSAAGSILVMSRQDQVHGFDAGGRSNVGETWIAGIHGPEGDEVTHLPLRLLRGEPLPVGREYVRRGLGVYGGGSGVDSPSVIAGRTVYYISQHEGNAGACLVAMETTGRRVPIREPAKTTPLAEKDREAILASNWDFDYLIARRGKSEVLDGLDVAVPGTIGQPDRSAKVPAPSDAELEKVLWEAPVVEPADHPLRPKLAAAVEELVSKDWAPLAFPEGKYPGDGYWALNDPVELHAALALAWPFLSDDLRAKARAAVARQEADPLAAPALDGKKGERREAYVFTQIQNVLPGRVRAPGLARLHPLWAYAHASGDWAWIEKRWGRIRDAGGPAEWKLDGKNGRLSGLIALARIAARLKDEAALTAARTRALAAMRERLEYEHRHARGGVYHYGASGTQRTGPARWTFLTPEIGRLCRTHAKEIQDSLVARYVDFHRPSWRLAWGILSSYGHENCTEMPIHAMTHFQAKAYLVETPPAELARAADIPWCRADLYHVQKLALAIRSAGRTEWKDVR